MLIKATEAERMLCPMVMASHERRTGMGICQGAYCMAWREVKTQGGEFGYCGMAGAPPRVIQPLLGQTILTALGRAEGEQPAILVPR